MANSDSGGIPNGDPARKYLEALERHPEASAGVTSKPSEMKLLDAASARFGFRFSGEDQGGDTGLGGRIKNRLGAIGGFFWKNKFRRIATVGSVGGAGGAVGILALFGVASGPFEFVHIAEVLTNLHFGHIQAASDLRVGKMVYKLITTGDPGELDFGDTRLGVFRQVAFKNKILTDLSDRGIDPEFGTLKTFKGFSVDTKATLTDPKTGKTTYESKYAGMSEDEALAQLKADLGNKGTITSGKDATGAWDGTFKISDPGFFEEPSLIRGMISISGRGGLSTWIRARTLIRYTEASNFHPFRKLDAKINEKVADLLKNWISERNQTLKDGISSSSADTTNAEEQTKDPQTGKTTDTPLPNESSGPLSSDNVTSTFDLIKSGAGIASLGAIGIAVICALKALHDHIGILQYVQVILPMMRMGNDIISAGNQIKSGQDLDQHELDYLSQQFNSIDPKTGAVLSSWNDAAPINQAMGNQGGIDVNPALKQAFGGPPAWLAWTTDGAVQGLCSAAGQIIAGAVSVVLGVITAGAVTAVVGLIQGALIGVITGQVINYIAGILSGNAVNVHANGAEWGNDIDYGARLSANAEAIQYGGTQLSNQQVAQLNADEQQQNALEFHSETLADRIFNPYDYRSIVGSMIDRLHLSSPQSFFAQITNIPSLIGSLFSLPASLLSANVHAASTPYQYPFPEFGFSDQDLNNPLVQDPVANAKAVGTLLDKNNTNGEPDYIQRALDCFGVAVTMTPDGWDAVPSTSSASSDFNNQDRSLGVDAYDSSSYSSDTCASSSDSNWLRIRFWIFDTGAMEGYACFLGDSTSCVNDGFSS